MKNLVLAVLLMTVFFAESNAQFMKGDEVIFGHAWTIGNRPNNTDRNFHPYVQVGRRGLMPLSQSIGLGFGTYFSTEGGSFKDENIDVKTEMRMNYIKVPVFASFHLGDAEKRIQPTIAVGPSISFLVGGKTFSLDKNDAIVGMKTKKYMDTKIDAGINADLGLSFRVKDGFWIKNGIHYYHGLVEQKPSAAGASFTNRNIGLSLGMLMNGNMMKWKNKHWKK